MWIEFFPGLEANSSVAPQVMPPWMLPPVSQTLKVEPVGRDRCDCPSHRGTRLSLVLPASSLMQRLFALLAFLALSWSHVAAIRCATADR